MNEPEDEILYGTAGYLQTLLVLKKAMQEKASLMEGQSDPLWSQITAKIDEKINQVTQKLISQTASGQTIMQVMFPRHRRRGSPYVGGAHGTLGVLYVVTQSLLMLENLNAGTADLLQNTFENILTLQTEEGGFPTMTSDGDRGAPKVLNHWCHGAPGAIAPLLAGA